tara:strand:+ start:689 stop:2284 length:1596 start_codon:yes stop_codon:yes gene_type:complete
VGALEVTKFGKACTKCLGLTLLSAVVLGCQTTLSPTTQDTAHRNVLFIVADDLNCDLSIFGHPLVKSPNLDDFAERAIVFQNAHAQYPHCGPSRASMMTGLYPDQTKIFRNNIYIRDAIPDVITMGQRFRQSGYRSIRIGKIFHYDNPSAIGTAGVDDIYSWDQTIHPYGRDKREEYKIKTLSPRKYGGTLSWLAMDGTSEEQTDGIGATEAVEQLDKLAASGEPFFLALGFYRPHTPFVAPKQFFAKYDKGQIEVPVMPADYLETLPESAQKSIRRKQNPTEFLQGELAQEIKAAYFATVSFLDEQIGRVLRKLEETGLDKNTVVVITSDHGYHLGEHGHWQKETLFQNSTHVPLMIYAPKSSQKGSFNDSFVELIDIYPTLMDLTGIVPPPFLAGQSLAPLLSANSDDVTDRDPLHENALTQWGRGHSLVDGRYRITRWNKGEELEWEFYDRAVDPEEMYNLVSGGIEGYPFDSLRFVLESRITEAEAKPAGLGRQFDNAQPAHKAPNITYGDIFDEHGEQTFLKPKTD